MPQEFENRTAEGDLPKKTVCKKGIVYVFSHDEFPSHEQRQGREIDEDRIKQHFSERLGFDVEEPFVNLSANEVKKKAVEAAADKKLENYDCVAVFVISQFKKIGKYLAKKDYYKEDDIIRQFVAQPTLVLKPKIFIFQASKATIRKSGSPKPFEADNKSGSVSYSLPVEANLFIVRSSLPYMTEKRGTWFIDQVCNHLMGQLPLQDEIVKVLKSAKEKRTVESGDEKLVFSPDATSTLVYKIFLSNNPVGDSLEAYDRRDRNGCLFIFNYRETYDAVGCEFKDRKGTQNDVKRMEKTFRGLGFDVVVENDLSDSDLLKILKSGTCEKDENNGRGRYFASDMCVIVAVFTHGNHGQLETTDLDLSPKRLFREVNAHTDLQGKPKIFILQVCRGDDYSQGVGVTGNVEADATEEEKKGTENESDGGVSYISPNGVPDHDNPRLRIDDMIVLHSTYHGKKSVRDPNNGTWLIQELCAEIDRKTSDNNEASLTDIFTNVQREVALKNWGDDKQMPVYTSTLTKKVIIGKRDC